MTQPEIAQRLGLSQSRISRLLKQASDVGIVRTVVLPPEGTFHDLEQALIDKYSLIDAAVAEPIGDDEGTLLAAIGAVGAAYLESTLSGSDLVGISSWSSSLLASVNSMTPRSTPMAKEIVQVIGGVGHPAAQLNANHLTAQLSAIAGADPIYCPAPGIVGSPATRDAMLADSFLESTRTRWSELTTLLVGIGTLKPSALLASSGNIVDAQDAQTLQAAGAVGDVCLRYFDRDGRPVVTEVDDRVLGISTPELLAVPRRVGIAGGARKAEAIRGALSGGWVNILVTDRQTAESLLESEPKRTAERP